MFILSTFSNKIGSHSIISIIFIKFLSLIIFKFMKDNKFSKYFNELKIIQSIMFIYVHTKHNKTDFNNDRTTTGLLNGILNGSGWIFII